jgi:hypothetical protein
MCSWVQEKGKCLLHVPETAPQQDGMASAGRVLLLRLIEELLRFAGKRQEIFNQRVSQLAVLDRPIREKDQYIIPEKSAVWTEILRLEWSRYNVEKPVYLEEMTQRQSRLKAILGDSANLHLYQSPTKKFGPLLNILGTSEENIGLEGGELADKSISNLLSILKLPVVQIDLRVEPPVILSRQPSGLESASCAVFILQKTAPVSLVVSDPEHPAILQGDAVPSKIREIVASSKKIFIRRN